MFKTRANNRSLAIMIAESEAFGGGYIYPGARWGYALPEPGQKNGFRPQLRTRVHFVKEYDRTPDQARTAWNKRILASLPIGSEVEMHSSLSGGKAWEIWRKEGPCSWSLTCCGSESETERLSWSRETGSIWEDLRNFA